MTTLEPIEKTYVLIENTQGDRHWFLKLNEYNELIVAEISERFSKSVGMQLFHSPTGYMTLDIASKYIDNYVDNIIKRLDEGFVILFNPDGGMHYLLESTKVVKEIKSYSFPDGIQKESLGITGWLSPEGVLLKCEYGDHYVFAQSYNGEDQDLYIPLSSNPLDSDLSNISINKNNITTKQTEWFKNNVEHLDKGQLEILKAFNII